MTLLDAQTIPVLFQPERCRVIRAEYAEAERLELITKYQTVLLEAEAALRDSRMKWLAEHIGEIGGERVVHLLVRQGYRKHVAEETVAECGTLLGNQLFALSNLRRLGASR